MNIDKLKGSGVEPWLIDRLRSWQIITLTDIQEKAIKSGAASGQSMIVSAPTSTGKTLVGEIAVLAALKSGMRAIYLVSHKALADQKYLDFESKFGERAIDPLASVGLNTGDRAEGDINSQLMVATYEKSLGLILSGQLKVADSLIVADELQIIGEQGRGPDIETLCAVFRQQKIKQFVALTATVQNPEDLAGWMGCELVQSFKRDVPLHQQIWYQNKIFQTIFGQDDGQMIDDGFTPPVGISNVVNHLLDLNRGPVLVFTESRREAADFARSFSRNRPRFGEGLAISEQLDLFSEPTESSQHLRENAERRVTFHSADLSPQERQVIEAGFINSTFEVCFATSTLAAGVNFPFRTIVFPKLTYQWGQRAGTHISLSDYRNMSGRAGRLSMHEDGYAVLLPSNMVELSHAKQIVKPTNEKLMSQLIALSLRKTILMLVASRIAGNIGEIMAFFKETLYWYQTLERNPMMLENLQNKCSAAINWLIQHEFMVEEDDHILITPFGNTAAITGLLPATVVQLASILKQYGSDFENAFDEWIDGIIYAICACEEFSGQRPSRFLPWPIKRSYDSVSYWSASKLPVALDRNDVKLAQCAQAIALYVKGLAERKISFTTNMSSGAIHRLSIDLAWVLDGLHKLTSVPELACPQTLGNKIDMLSRRVRWGAPAEALDMMRVAVRHDVPGFGRQRSMALVSQGITTLHDILSTTKEKLLEILRNEQRAKALIDAASSAIGFGPSRLAFSHSRAAKKLGIEKIVDSCNQSFGTEYEKAIVELLQVESSWIVKILDNRGRQNVPDLLLKIENIEMLIECKTSSKSPPFVKKEEAWAVIQKAADFDVSMRRITLGKPAFDETSKVKAAVSQDITLVEHISFVEGVLRVHTGSLKPIEFIKWLLHPGLAEIDRLGGVPTYSIM